jgi:4,5-dihydroxyphthalate decarboxylase
MILKVDGMNPTTQPDARGLPFTFASGLYDRMQALYTGEVRPAGIDLNFIPIDSPRLLFDRLAGGGEFDGAEFSASEFITRFCEGQCPFVALPVFPSRVFRHGFITINTRSGINSPKDLEGKRIGVPLYTMTAAIWIRAHLQHDFGVDLSKIQWVEGAINSVGRHGEPSILPLMREMRITSNDTGKSLSQLLDEGEIDAIIGTALPEARRHNADIRRLFPNFHEIERAYFSRTGIFPIMHLTVIRRSVYERNPFIAQSMYDALCAAKKVAAIKMRTLGSLRYMLPWMTEELDELDVVFGDDPWPYGLGANRATLTALVRYMVEQGLLRSEISIEKLFLPINEQSAPL